MGLGLQAWLLVVREEESADALRYSIFMFAFGPCLVRILGLKFCSWRKSHFNVVLLFGFGFGLFDETVRTPIPKMRIGP